MHSIISPQNLTRTPKTHPCLIRYILRRDLEFVCEFDTEQSCYDLINLLKRRDTTGFVAEHKELIVGYCIYSFNSDIVKIRLLNVKSEHRRQGIAKAMIQALAVSRFNHKLIAYVPEDNLGALNLYKSLGFTSKLMPSKFKELDGIKMTLTRGNYAVK